MSGKITALVGPSGAGKSTIAALLNGFYDPSKGSLLVNGLSRSAILKDQYLSQVSMVRQTPALFTDTVASNIAYGAVAYRSVTRDEIIQAAKQVGSLQYTCSCTDNTPTPTLTTHPLLH